MKPRKEVLALVGTTVVLAGAGYWYGTGDETAPISAVAQNNPKGGREHKPPVKGQHVRRGQATISDEAEPEVPKRNQEKAVEKVQMVRPIGANVPAKKDKTPRA